MNIGIESKYRYRIWIWHFNKQTAKQNKTKQNKTKQNKTKQNKTKQNKTKQNKTKQNKTKLVVDNRAQSNFMSLAKTSAS